MRAHIVGGGFGGFSEATVAAVSPVVAAVARGCENVIYNLERGSSFIVTLPTCVSDRGPGREGTREAASRFGNAG